MASSSNFRIVQGDLLASSEPFIVHQCNCRSTFGKGLAQVLFRKFPYSDVYKLRKARGDALSAADRAAGKHFDKPGTITIRRATDGKKAKQMTLSATGTLEQGVACSKPAIINLFGQDNYGKRTESPLQRERWFKLGLDEIAARKVEESITSLAMPHGIGCGRAGGNWQHYEAMLCTFAAENTDIRITLYRQ
eukprot:m.218825 g.218825  ORF g.218825 m.218825 type:complete len:192 (+) comp17225_c1_seq7:2293-2868(+)